MRRLRRSRARPVTSVVTCLGFTVVAVATHAWWGAVFFGVCGLVGVHQLLWPGRLQALGQARAARRATASVSWDDVDIQRSRRRVTRVGRWRDLEAVVVLTSTGGPLRDDVAWLLVGAPAGSLVIPSGAMPRPLMSRLLDLPGFDHQALIDAMSSTATAQFTVWTRTGSSGPPRAPTGTLAPDTQSPGHLWRSRRTGG